MRMANRTDIDSIDTDKFTVLIRKDEIAALNITEDGCTRISLRGGRQVDVTESFVTLVHALCAPDRSVWFLLKMAPDEGR